MITESAFERRATSSGEEAVAHLREAGGHPLMYSFPQGAIFAFDHDLRVLSAGGGGLEGFGLSREMLEGRTIFEAFPEHTAAVIEPYCRAALAGETTTWDVAHRGRTYSQRLAPVVDSAGTIVAGMGFTLDVTETRASEQALRESEQRNRLTFEHAPIGQAIVELDGTWRHANTAVTTLLGYSEDQLLELTFQDLTHPDDLDVDLGLLDQLVAGDIGSYQIEKRYFTATGHIVWALLSVALVRDEEKVPLYFISQIQDITERKRQQQALQDLTAMLAHDLQTPAAVVLGFAELLETSPGSDHQDVVGHASRIAAAARAMTDLLDNALTAAQLGSGQLVAMPASVRIKRSAAAAVQALDLGSVSTDTSGLEDLVAWVDPVHLSRVMTNLLTNAAKYGGDTVVISASSEQDRVRISVADNGRGVEPDFVQHLFDRFSRSDAARDGRKPGTGLGLYIVRDLLAANDGTIRYAPSPSGGAEFTISLRAAPGPRPHGDR
jgi:PAS domain S-box-containing protein